MTQTIKRKVQITRDEFLRQLPNAIGDRTFKVTDDGATVHDGSKSVFIKLNSLGKKEMGELELPMQQIHFEFEGYSDNEAKDFMESYDAHKLRGMGGM